MAGTAPSEDLGYELKCEGLDYCTFTSKFELAYLLITGFLDRFPWSWESLTPACLHPSALCGFASR
ncbi:MAG: hypothetical protein MZU97_06590 [Bacillus subtilis]|nr:hypothetical protein [Bacillus subtilis]